MSNRQLPNDPLSGLNERQVWRTCIKRDQTLTSAQKWMLTCIGDFFDKEGRNGTVSLKTLSRYCVAHEDTVSSWLTSVRKLGWIKTEFKRGFKTLLGRQNLYHSAIPGNVLEAVRAEVAAEKTKRQLEREMDDYVHQCNLEQRLRDAGHKVPVMPSRGAIHPPSKGGDLPPHNLMSKKVSKKESKSGFQKVSFQEGKKVRGPVIVARADDRNLADVLSDDHNPIESWEGGAR